MKDSLSDFTKKLQEKIYMEVKEEWGEDIFERWEKLLYRGKIDDPDGYACLTGKCGDTMEIFLRFEKERVKEASYMTDGCSSSNLCGSFAAELSLGKTPDELLDVTGETIFNKLGNLPSVEEHCAYLAAETLQEALNDFMIKHFREAKKYVTKSGQVNAFYGENQDKNSNNNGETGESGK